MHVMHDQMQVHEDLPEDPAGLRTPIYACKLVQALPRKKERMKVSACINTHTHTHTHTLTHTHHTQRHTYTHACAHTHTHTYTHVVACTAEVVPGKPVRVERLLANLGYGKRKDCAVSACCGAAT